MASFTSVCQRILAQPTFGSRALIGGLISFVPVVNLLALGYLLQFGRRARHGHLDLPPWADWLGLLRDGLLAFLIMLPWAGIPLLVGWGLSMVLAAFFSFVWLDFLAVSLAWAPLMAGLAIGLPLFLSALLKFVEREELRDAFDFQAVLGQLKGRLGLIVVPTLAAFGIIFLGWPLFGLGFFLGSLLLLAYYAVSLEA